MYLFILKQQKLIMDVLWQDKRWDGCEGAKNLGQACASVFTD